MFEIILTVVIFHSVSALALFLVLVEAGLHARDLERFDLLAYGFHALLLCINDGRAPREGAATLQLLLAGRGLRTKVPG